MDDVPLNLTDTRPNVKTERKPKMIRFAQARSQFLGCHNQMQNEWENTCHHSENCKAHQNSTHCDLTTDPSMTDVHRSVFLYSDMVRLQVLSTHSAGRVNKNRIQCTLCTARLHNRLICRHNNDHINNDEHNRAIIVVLAKHRLAPWWWFLHELKHDGANVGILIVLTFLWFYNCVHQLEK